ncbi:unnamed protein product [Prunus brigantina]
MVNRIYVDEGNAAIILQLLVIQHMCMETKINKSARSLTGLNGATSVIVDTIDLDVYFPSVISSQSFMIINEVSLYNGILGKPWIVKINAITSVTRRRRRRKGNLCNRIFSWGNLYKQIGAFIESTSYTQRVLKESVPPIFQSTEAFQTTMVGSMKTRGKTAAMAKSATA